MRETFKTLWHRWNGEVWRVLRFGITGTLSSLLHYGVYCLSLLFLNYNVSYTIGYLVGLVFNYVMTARFTFRKRASRRNAIGFAGSHVLNYLLEMVLLNVFLHLSVSEWLAPVLVMVVVVPINFLLLRFVFVSRR